MARIEKSVFISYRRTNFHAALSIYQSLTHHGYDVFFDYQGLASGDFETVILENIRSSAHFVVLLTPSALERCSQPGDWLRCEIEAALDNRRNNVPLLIDGFNFTTPMIARQLTGKLEILKRYNALDVPPAYFEAAMERLRNKFLNVALDMVLHPASVTAVEIAALQKTAANAAPAVAEEKLTAQSHFERATEATGEEEQIHLYTEAIRLNPIYSDAFSGRGKANYYAGNLAEALWDCGEAIRLNPKDITAFSFRGLVRAEKGDHSGAIKDLDEAIRLNPTQAGLYCDRGRSLGASGDHRGAIRDYDQALFLDSTHAETHHERGNAYAAVGDMDSAIRDYDESLRRRPRDCITFFNRGNARRIKEDFDGAIRDFTEALRLNPEHTASLNNRAFARASQGDIEGAIRDYQAVLRIDPKHLNALANLSVLPREKR